MREAYKFIKKRDSGTGVSCRFSEIFKNTFFTEHLRAALSALNNLCVDKVSRNIV